MPKLSKDKIVNENDNKHKRQTQYALGTKGKQQWGQP